ncbi:30S ribosomal protein S16 [Jiulongibacter sediminis]|uniref:Small ribosomal subunit protein bS16 n=1 Tax=Jiulongibacter sediminis TaxID=1605367 RepID=A0A0P7C5H8_9BACT|nr:30S ribosomal protein S16 [Jiulongibacter sediminis]KPM49575.1 30S ribosomal protein S16 [Jiulongibacter sediminis]TBX26614.1 30S ribosomal protein S16 [Jiulongibacter sediminis]
MAVKIRLSRHGRKKRAIYNIVVADARAPRDGKFIEKLGQYNPNVTPAGLELNDERALHWLMTGAQPTDTTRKILSVRGLMLQKHLQVGVTKGAITQEEADKKLDAWKADKEKSREERIAKLTGDKDAAKKAALEAERKKKEEVEAKKKEAEAALIAEAEAAEAAKAAEEAGTSEEEAPAAESTDEAPAAEEAPAEEAEGEKE